jgi:uncharacterized RDD family membrane protein YckC
MTAYAGRAGHTSSRPALVASGRWRRFVAFVLDQVILAVPTAIIGVLTLMAAVDDWGSLTYTANDGTAALTVEGEAQLRTAIAWVAIALGATAAFYYIIFTALFGQTPGKAILGIQVIETAGGAVPSIATASIRYGVYALPGLIATGAAIMGISISSWDWVLGIAWLAIVGWIFIDPVRRGVHDMVAGTVVVSTEQPSERGRF